MKKTIVIFVVFVLVGAGIGAIYFTQSQDLVHSAKRLDVNTLEKKIPEDGWQQMVVLQERNFTDEEREQERKNMGEYYQYIKGQPWEVANLDPYSNNNAKTYCDLLGGGHNLQGYWGATYVNIDLQDVIDHFEDYAGELIYLECNRLIDCTFYEAGSEESNALVKGEGFGVFTYEDIYGQTFQLLSLPPGAKTDYECMLASIDPNNVETQIHYVLGCPIGIIDGDCVVLGN